MLNLKCQFWYLPQRASLAHVGSHFSFTSAEHFHMTSAKSGGGKTNELLWNEPIWFPIGLFHMTSAKSGGGNTTWVAMHQASMSSGIGLFHMTSAKSGGGKTNELLWNEPIWFPIGLFHMTPAKSGEGKTSELLWNEPIWFPIGLFHMTPAKSGGGKTKWFAMHQASMQWSEWCDHSAVDLWCNSITILG